LLRNLAFQRRVPELLRPQFLITAICSKVMGMDEE
jgi:hypothetical protein